jgi:hypothetical protein
VGLRVDLGPVTARVSRAGIALSLVAATACATHDYMGISLTPGQAPPELQHLALRAQAGDKQAQLDLGIRFEEGVEVPQNRERAMHLYRQAATESGGTRWVYSPPVGDGLPGRVIPIGPGVKQPGLAEAKCRLAGQNGC